MRSSSIGTSTIRMPSRSTRAIGSAWLAMSQSEGWPITPMRMSFSRARASWTFSSTRILSAT